MCRAGTGEESRENLAVKQVEPAPTKAKDATNSVIFSVSAALPVEPAPAKAKDAANSAIFSVNAALPVELAPVEEKDRALLAGMMKRAFDDDTRMHTALEADGPPGYADGSLLTRLARKENCVVEKLLWNGETVGAYAALAERDICTLELLFVDPRKKNLGIGGNAWKAIRDKFPQAKRWYVETPAYSVRNQRFYQEKCGFHVLRRRDCGNGEYAVVFVQEMQGGEDMFQAVVFDMDGLMFDTERMIQRSWDVVGVQMGFGKMGKDIYHTLGLNNAQREQYFKDTYGEDFPYLEFRENYRAEVHRVTMERGTPVKKGLYELLEVLREKGLRLAVATSSSYESAKRLLEEAKVFEYFHAVVTGNMVERSKPAPDIYLKACEALGVSPEYALALEDSYNGIRSAHAAGMKVIMVPDLLTDSSCVDELLYGKVESLADVAELLQNLDLPPRSGV